VTGRSVCTSSGCANLLVSLLPRLHVSARTLHTAYGSSLLPYHVVRHGRELGNLATNMYFLLLECRNECKPCSAT
jgi:hypothetical protein